MANLRAQLSTIPVEVAGASKEAREYVNGWGVFALPFDSGHVLALRVFPQASFGPYVAIWHRDPEGRWAIYVDGIPLDAACPRYFGPACHQTALSVIQVQWTGRCSLSVRMSEPALEWAITASSTRALTVVNALSRSLPTFTWALPPLVRAREVLAKRLGLGSLRLNGVMPSGHQGQLRPRQMFFVEKSTAVLGGDDLGRPKRLAANPTIGDFPLPARGVLVQGGAVWDDRSATLHDNHSTSTHCHSDLTKEEIPCTAATSPTGSPGRDKKR